MKQEPVEFVSRIARPARRALTFIVDICAFFVLSAFFFTFISFNIVKNINPYKSNYETQVALVDECRDMYYDGHLIVQLEDGTDQATSVTMLNYIKYKANETEQKDSDGHYNDMFAYFYLEYANDNLIHDEITDSYDVDYVNAIFSEFNTKTEQLWDIPLDGTVATLKADYRANVLEYVNGNITTDSQNAYLKCMEFVKEALVKCDETLQTSTQFTETYSKVIACNTPIYLSISVSSTITYTICFAIYFVILPMFKGKGKTLGMKVLNLSLVNEKEEYCSKKQMLLRNIIQYVLYYFLANFIPVMSVGVAVFELPLIFNIKFFIFSIVTIVMTLASFIVVIASKNHQALQENATNTYVVDTRGIVYKYKKGN